MSDEVSGRTISSSVDHWVDDAGIETDGFCIVLLDGFVVLD
jgi:hypothetical protein